MVEEGFFGRTHRFAPTIKIISIIKMLYINGEKSLAEAIELCNVRTRQYAKRQVTWFRNKLENAINLPFSKIDEYDSIIDKMCSNIAFALMIVKTTENWRGYILSGNNKKDSSIGTVFFSTA